MSFGFGVGDFLAVIKLAEALRSRFAGAPEQYKSIATEMVPIVVDHTYADLV